jgi:hypothetical protein
MNSIRSIWRGGKTIVTANDPLMFAAVAGILIAAALVAARHYRQLNSSDTRFRPDRYTVRYN